MRKLDQLDSAQYSRLSASERRQVERELELDLPAETPLAADAMSRLLVPYRDTEPMDS